MTVDARTSESPIAWHYTTGEGMRGIIEGHVLRASSAAFMNDAHEMRTGVQALQGAYQRLNATLTEQEQQAIERGNLLRESAVDDWFLVSGSAHRDLLTLWRSYASGVAYAIGFDASVPLAPVEQCKGEAHPSAPPGYYEDAYEEIDGRMERLYDPDYVGVFGGTWRDVTYVDPAGLPGHEEVVREYARRWTKDRTGKSGFLVDVGAIAESTINYEKDYAFRDEREVRIIVEVSPSWKFLKYRDSRFGLVPFVELGAGGTPGGVGQYVPYGTKHNLPVREIMIGPNMPDVRAAERALRRFLDDRGYGEVAVSRSNLPFR